VANYFLTLIDDYTRKIWIYLLKHKLEALERFKFFIDGDETYISRKIKILRSDSGGEYNSNDFIKFCKN